MEIKLWLWFIPTAMLLAEAEIQFNQDLVGVYVSPFVEEGRPDNSYSLEEIQEMLEVVKPYFSLISTYPLRWNDNCFKLQTATRSHQTLRNAATAELGAVRRTPQSTSFPIQVQTVLLLDKTGLPIGAVLPDFDSALSVQKIEKLTITPRDLCDSSALIPLAAATLNKDHAHRHLTVLVAAYSNRNPSLPERDTWELDNAFAAAQEANRIFPGTVASIALVSVPPKGWNSELLSILEAAVDDSQGHGFYIGLRTDCNMNLLAGDLSSDFRRVARKLDFLHCRIFPSITALGADPSAAEAPRRAAEEVMERFLELKHAAEDLNPAIQVAIGETKWARFPMADLPTHSKNLVTYWKCLNKLAVQNQVKVLMTAAFDEKIDMFGKMNSDSGLWYRKVDNSSNVSYVAKF